MIDFLSEANQLFPYAQGLRRDFHMHPELGFKEVRTSGIVIEELSKLGIEVTTGVGKTGVIGLIQGKAPGKVLMLRFDMDALPVTEETGAEYASQSEGVMHACGHDGHVAIGLSVAKLLHKYKDQFDGTIKLVFQPAEEVVGGAQRMIEEGVLENPRPDYSLCVHVWNASPVGEILVTSGPVMAGAEFFQIYVKGKGAHAALPQLGHDPIVASAQIISALQSIRTRNIDPLDAAVLSITAVNGGTAFNVIPPLVEMKGTIRMFLPELRETIHRRMKEIIEGVAKSMGCEAELEFLEYTPPVINDASLANLIQQEAQAVLPNTTVLDGFSTMGAEDMAYMMEEIPGCYMFVGSKNEEKNLIHAHHHPKFDFDEQALIHGIALLTSAAIKVLQD